MTIKTRLVRTCLFWTLDLFELVLVGFATGCIVMMADAFMHMH